eukprot:m.138731 g.138731  ORF g.138731 m.138731 type:complete len:95 (-) comp52540_c0_seq4:125-409(-)
MFVLNDGFAQITVHVLSSVMREYFPLLPVGIHSWRPQERRLFFLRRLTGEFVMWLSRNPNVRRVGEPEFRIDNMVTVSPLSACQSLLRGSGTSS